jgi:hypothetical protein
MYYTRKAWTVVAYTFNADTYCLDCMHKIAMRCADMSTSEGVTLDDAMATWAAMFGIDINDEHSYDSGDFPKVVFSGSVEGVEHCGECHEEID